MLRVMIRGLSKRQIKLLKALQAEKRPLNPRDSRFDKIPERELKELESQLLIVRDDNKMVILPSMSEAVLMGR